jgi:uncharacterized protein YndB with AHSA1/START domain
VKTWIVSYADAAFASSLDRLMASAARYAIDERRPWRREALERTALYRLHATTLDLLRGGGYWLWKPFIITQTLHEMAPGDLLVYADAGIEIVDHLDPLFRLCAAREVLLFANHYDHSGGSAPNVCAKWTKRDCFVFMDCDERRYHHAPAVDASCLIVVRTERTLALIREWLLYCCQTQLLIDSPNACGLPNLDTFVEHRHDQSILSILAARESIELFRHPSQYGDRAKDAHAKSPYPALLNHHRGHLGQTDLQITLRRHIPAPRDRVFQAWHDPQVLRRWTPLGRSVIDAKTDVRNDGRYQLTIAGLGSGAASQLVGTYLEVSPPARLVYTWPLQSPVTVDFGDAGDRTAVTLCHGPFPSEKLREYHAHAWNHYIDAVTAAVQA